MAQGNANRVMLPGTGTASPGDVFSATLGLDSRWEIVPGSVKIWWGVAAGTDYGWGSGNGHVASDDGAGNIVGEAGYLGVSGLIDYATGAITVNEGVVNIWANGDRCWVEYYESFPTSPADDFYAAYSTNQATTPPLVITRVPHSSFASRQLVNHGTYCLGYRQLKISNNAGAEFLLRDPSFFTNKPVMSELAFRLQTKYEARIGPKLIHRCPTFNSSTRAGYRYGPYQGTTPWNIGISDKNNFAYPNNTFNEHWNGSNQTPRIRSYNTNGTVYAGYADNPDNVAPNLYADDWHKLRMISTLDSNPGDLHFHCLLAVGSTEVDKAVPTFETLYDVWHQTAVDDAIATFGRARSAEYVGTWGGDLQGYPPEQAYAGFVLGGYCYNTGQWAWVDDFRAYRMP